MRVLIMVSGQAMRSEGPMPDSSHEQSESARLISKADSFQILVTGALDREPPILLVCSFSSIMNPRLTSF